MQTIYTKIFYRVVTGKNCTLSEMQSRGQKHVTGNNSIFSFRCAMPKNYSSSSLHNSIKELPMMDMRKAAAAAAAAGDRRTCKCYRSNSLSVNRQPGRSENLEARRVSRLTQKRATSHNPSRRCSLMATAHRRAPPPPGVSGRRNAAVDCTDGLCCRSGRRRRRPIPGKGRLAITRSAA